MISPSSNYEFFIRKNRFKVVEDETARLVTGELPQCGERALKGITLRKLKSPCVRQTALYKPKCIRLRCFGFGVGGLHR